MRRTPLIVVLGLFSLAVFGQILAPIIGGGVVVVSLPTGAAAHLKPSSLVGGVNLGDQIATWTDVTGNGWSATQVTSGNQATFVPAVNTVAGKQPAIWFGGHTGVLNGVVDTFMTIPSGLATNQNNLSILVFGEAGATNGPTNYILAQLGQSGGSFTTFWPTPGLATYQDGFVAQVGGSTVDPHIPTQSTGPFMYFLSSQSGVNGITISDGVTTFQQAGPSSGALTGGALGSYSATGLSLPLVGSEQENRHLSAPTDAD